MRHASGPASRHYRNIPPSGVVYRVEDRSSVEPAMSEKTVLTGVECKEVADGRVIKR